MTGLISSHRLHPESTLEQPTVKGRKLLLSTIKSTSTSNKTQQSLSSFVDPRDRPSLASSFKIRICSVVDVLSLPAHAWSNGPEPALQSCSPQNTPISVITFQEERKWNSRVREHVILRQMIIPCTTSEAVVLIAGCALDVKQCTISERWRRTRLDVDNKSASYDH